MEYVGLDVKKFWKKDITGAFTWQEDGDYKEIWFSDDSRPFELNAWYVLVGPGTIGDPDPLKDHPKSRHERRGDDAGTQDGGGSFVVLVIMAGVLIAIYLLFRKPKSKVNTRNLTPDQIAFLLNTGQMSLADANRSIGGN